MFKNILILINVRWWNATAFYAINIARILHNHGHKVIVGCNPEYPAFPKAKSYGLRVAPLNFYGYNLCQLISNFIKMLKIIKTENIQIINAHRSEDQFYALLTKLISKTKCILTRGDRRKIKNNIFSMLKYKLANAIILTCKAIYEQNKIVLKNKPVHIIYGSVDEEHFIVKKSKVETAKKYKIDLSHPIIGMAGRLDYVKDQYTFVNGCGIVATQDKKVNFILAGKQEHIKAEELRHLAKRYNIENRLTILPEISDIPDIINLFDIAVITSIDSETISRVLLEYLYLKKPVIGTQVNVIPEIIKEGYNGEIIKPGDYRDLADKILKLLKNKNIMRNYSKNAFQSYNDFYSEKTFYNLYTKVFENL